MKRWIVTAVDYGDSCDGKARVLGVFPTRQKAETYVEKDIDKWGMDDVCGITLSKNYDTLSADYDKRIGCEWNIEVKEFA